MAELISCLECGEQVSSAANSCPNCNARYFGGRKCAACLRISKGSAGVETRDGDNFDWIDNACYEEFQREYQSVHYTCPLCAHIESCQTKLKDNLLVPFFPDCSKCGHPPDGQFYASHCLQCRAYVIRITSVGTSSYPKHKKCEDSTRANIKPVVENKSGCSAVILLVLLFAVGIFGLTATHF